ncbi:hypothetical protein [Acinetobacter soli]|uniref:hypothetical protein n=1 Tax=Acinetobacter soli TaxID=487316 RepID=UPI00125D7C78|nr:hypothetical protein [Acinetobacter soli]
MGVATEIRKAMPTCGRCVNCKIVYWSDDIDPKKNQKANLIKTFDGEYYFMVRCSWLKIPVAEPQFLLGCEGKILQKNNNGEEND